MTPYKFFFTIEYDFCCFFVFLCPFTICSFIVFFIVFASNVKEIITILKNSRENKFENLKMHHIQVLFGLKKHEIN